MYIYLNVLFIHSLMASIIVYYPKYMQFNKSEAIHSNFDLNKLKTILQRGILYCVSQ